MVNKNHFLDINDIEKEEVVKIINVAKVLKKATKMNAVPKLLDGYNLAMIFEIPSTRTRISFENAMTLLGGHALYLKPGEIHYGSRENIEDTSKVLSRLCDGILIRSYHHETMIDFAKYAEVPVINGLTKYNHPSQAIADVMTIMEQSDKKLEDLRVTFIGDRTNVCNSLLNICMKLDITFQHIAPKRYQVLPEVLKAAQDSNPNYEKEIIISDSVKHLKGSDIIYTDLWWWVDQEDEKQFRKNVFSAKYQVDMKKMLKAKNPSVKFMHCMPISHELEVTDEVINSDYSIVLDQSENRLYVEMAILVLHLTASREKCAEVKKEQIKQEILYEMKK